MHNIIPAIIPQSAEHLLSSLRTMRFAPRIQIDIVDGVFARPASWPYLEKSSVADIADALGTHFVTVDIMSCDPRAAALEWLEAGAEELVVHIETISDLEDICVLKNKFDFSLYLAADDDTPIEQYAAWLKRVDGVQLMGIDEVGGQGRPFSPKVTANIQTVRKLFPNLPIVIDGSVHNTTILELLAAGADHFVVGSAIVGSADPRAAYQELCDLVV